MALTVDKDGKIIDKHLTVDESLITKIISNTDKEKHRKIFLKATKTKINHRIVPRKTSVLQNSTIN